MQNCIALIVIKMLNKAQIAQELEALRKYQFKEGYCFLCGECCEGSTAVLHFHCAIAYSDIKEEIVKRIYDEIETG